MQQERVQAAQRADFRQGPDTGKEYIFFIFFEKIHLPISVSVRDYRFSAGDFYIPLRISTLYELITFPKADS